MGDMNSLLIGLVFGSIGVGYCIYGKKQNHFIAFLVGLLLMGLPYVIENNLMLIICSVLLMFVPKFIKL
jgi:hypothetical protein